MATQNHARLSVGPSLALAHDPTTSAETLATLIGSSDPEVRAEVAVHPNSAPEMIETLANDPHYVVLAAVAANPRIPTATLDRIADRVAHAPHAGAPDEWSSRKNLREAVEFAVASHRPKTLLSGVIETAAAHKDAAPAPAPTLVHEPKRSAQR